MSALKYTNECLKEKVDDSNGRLALNFESLSVVQRTSSVFLLKNYLVTLCAGSRFCN